METRNHRRLRKILLVLGVLAACAGAALWNGGRPRLTVRNACDARLDDLSVLVGGRVLWRGSLEAEQAFTVVLGQRDRGPLRVFAAGASWDAGNVEPEPGVVQFVRLERDQAVERSRVAGVFARMLGGDE